MNAEWVVREGRPDALLFFNGWGMDRSLADWIRSERPDLESHDVVVLYDYADLALPDGLLRDLAGYRAVDLAAWSLGVWAALGAGLDGIRCAVALNGTPYPIDGGRGIPPAVFGGTLEHWSDASRARFERRMFAGIERDPRIGSVRSCRSSAAQQEELRAIAGAAAPDPGGRRPSWVFSKAVVGGRDLIFPPAHQLAAWQGTETVVVDDMPHFPFFHLDGWTEVFA